MRSWLRDRSARQSRFRLEWIDPGQPWDAVEAPIRGDDQVQAPVERGRRMDRVAHAKGLDGLEEAQGAAEIRLGQIVELAEKGDVGGFPDRLLPVSLPPAAHVDELLDHLDARFSMDLPIRGQADEPTAGLSVRMLRSDRIEEDGGVEKETDQSRSRQIRPEAASDSSPLRVSQSSTGIGAAARKRAPAARRDPASS